MLGYLLARAHVPVIVLEKHGDFLRDFRGDTIHPSTLEIMLELGLLDEFLRLPHQELQRITGVIAGERVNIADFTHLPTHCKFVGFIPQWDLRNFNAGKATRLANFELRMNTSATDLLKEEGRVVGIVAQSGAARSEIRAHLVVAADGRSSTLRAAAGLVVDDVATPIDVLWLRIRKGEQTAPPAFGYVADGKILVTLDRAAYWQCAYIIPKNGLARLRERGLAAFRADLTAIAPHLGAHVDELSDWDDVKLLTVKIDRLQKWFASGLLCIGDAAHAMSPIGGVGINLAIQDAVAAANLLAEPLRRGRVDESLLQKLQDRRELPARWTQRAQALIQNYVIDPVLANKTQLVRAPWPIRLVSKLPLLQRIPARLVGVGIRPEHVSDELVSS